jgi:hypothetical protein
MVGPLPRTSPSACAAWRAPTSVGPRRVGEVVLSHVCNYGVHMAGSKTDVQARAIIDYINGQPGPVHGERLKVWLKARNYNLWQSSILISKMVDDGRLKVTNRVLDDSGSGKTFRRVYAVTQKGVGWSATSSVESLVKAIDLEPTVERAMETGKWTPLPDGVEWDVALGLRRRGFQVRVFVRWEDETAEVKVSL